jgi:hypothetical protein
VATRCEKRSACWRRRGNRAELLHQAEGVHEDTAVGHLAGFEAIDHNAFDPDRFAGGGDAEECVAVGSGPGEAGDDFFAFRDLLRYGPVDIGEGGPKLHEDGFESFPALLLAGQRIEFDEVLFDEVAHALEAAFIENLIDKCANDFFIC